MKAMKTKIELKRISGEIFFSHECEDNSVAKTIDALRTSGAEFDLRNADLRCADLVGAILSDVNLSGSNLSGAYLSGADLRCDDLSDVNLSDVNLRNANLSGAYLVGANLSGANLRNAILSDADLSGADLRNINVSESTVFFLPQCPSEGSFVAWKKAGKIIVKLLVTEDAKRSSATTLKCRCSKAKVLAIENMDGSESELKEVESSYDCNFVYRVGETVEVENFDDDRWNECSSGIHFFIARDMAVKY